MDVKVALTTHMLDVDVPLRDVMEFKPGDIIPVEMPETITVLIEDLPNVRLVRSQSRQFGAENCRKDCKTDFGEV